MRKRVNSLLKKWFELKLIKINRLIIPPFENKNLSIYSFKIMKERLLIINNKIEKKNKTKDILSALLPS